jgi:hypothetical protein
MKRLLVLIPLILVIVVLTSLAFVALPISAAGPPSDEQALSASQPNDDGTVTLAQQQQYQQRMWLMALFAAVIIGIILTAVFAKRWLYRHIILRLTTGTEKMWNAFRALRWAEIKIPITVTAIIAAICVIAVIAVTFTVGPPSAIMLVLAVTLVILAATLVAKMIRAMKQTDFSFLNNFDFATPSGPAGFFGHTTSAKRTGFFTTDMKKMNSGSNNHQRTVGNITIPFALGSKVSSLPTSKQTRGAFDGQTNHDT